MQILEGVVPSSELNGHSESSEANGTSSTQSPSEGLARQGLLFCERFLEFLIDLMSQAPTRRYSHTLLEDKAVLIKCRMSTLFKHEKGSCITYKTRFALVSQGLNA